jgi:hypothetical protein
MARETKTRRRWLLTCLALLLGASAAALGWALTAKHPLEALARRVPLGVDEDAVSQFIGRPPDGVIGKVGRAGVVSRRVACWDEGDDMLLGPVLTKFPLSWPSRGRAALSAG